jgi:hypothetical protein
MPLSGGSLGPAPDGQIWKPSIDPARMTRGNLNSRNSLGCLLASGLTLEVGKEVSSVPFISVDVHPTAEPE